MIGHHRTYQLPWELNAEQDRQFRQLVLRTGIIVFLLAVLVSLLPVPELPIDKIEKVPPRFAKLLLDKPKPPPPPPVIQPKPEEPKLEPKVAEKKPELKKPEPWLPRLKERLIR